LFYNKNKTAFRRTMIEIVKMRKIFLNIMQKIRMNITYHYYKTKSFFTQL